MTDDIDPTCALTLPPLPAPSRAQKSPAALYLASLPSETSVETQRASIHLLANLMVPGARGDEIPWEALTVAHVSVLVGTLNQKYASASVQKHLCALRGVLKAAWRVELITQETLARLLDQARGPRAHKDAPLAGRCLELTEINALFDSCSGYNDASRDAAVLALAYGAGLRRGEVASVLLTDYRAGKLTVTGKGRKVREIPLPPTAQDVLEMWVGVSRARFEFVAPPADTLLLADGQGRGLSESGVYACLERIADRANVDDFSPHDLRRSFITHLLESGADPITVARLAGHEDVKTTMRYDRRKDKVKAAATAKLQVPTVAPMGVPDLAHLFDLDGRRGWDNGLQLPALRQLVESSAIVVSEVMLPAAYTAEDLKIGQKVRGGVEHSELAAFAVAHLRSVGKAAAVEVDYRGGRCDVAAVDASILVECGSTPARKPIQACEDGIPLLLIPYLTRPPRAFLFQRGPTWK